MKRCAGKSCGHYQYVHQDKKGFCWASFPRACNCPEFLDPSTPSAEVSPAAIVTSPKTSSQSGATLDLFLAGTRSPTEKSTQSQQESSTSASAAANTSPRPSKTPAAQPANTGSASTSGKTSNELSQEYKEILTGKPPWSGAIPDVSKLAAETQAGILASEFWWAGVKCDFCIYEAGGCYLGVYFCRLHENLVI